MTKLQHTPGPWHVGSEHEIKPHPNGDLGEFEYRYNTTGWPYFVGVNEQRIGRTDYHTACSVQSEADARLIAAAPELLSACEKVLGVLNHGTPNPHSEHIDRIRAAIAKATGQ